MPASAEELKEIEELKAMIRGTPERPSTVPIGAVGRFMVGEENRAKADAARKEREERDQLKADLVAQRAAHAAKVKDDAAKRQEHERQVRDGEKRRKADDAQRLRQREAKWKAEADKNKQQQWDKAYKRVQDENEQWKRMNASEAAQDKLEREEGTRERKAVDAAFRAEREQTLQAKREQVARVKKSTDQAIVEEALAWAANKRETAAEARRKQRAELQEKRSQGKESFVAMAHSVKGQVNAMKENARAVQNNVLQKKKEHAAKERDNDYLVQQEKIRVLASKKMQHQNVYGKKYAPSAMAESWVGASTLRRGGPARGVGSPEQA
jgi:hypothetical protein